MFQDLLILQVLHAQSAAGTMARFMATPSAGEELVEQEKAWLAEAATQEALARLRGEDGPAPAPTGRIYLRTRRG